MKKIVVFLLITAFIGVSYAQAKEQTSILSQQFEQNFNHRNKITIRFIKTNKHCTLLQIQDISIFKTKTLLKKTS